MFDEHQHVQALAQHGIHMHEVDGEDPGCLGMQQASRIPGALGRTPKLTPETVDLASRPRRAGQQATRTKSAFGSSLIGTTKLN
jgi:hypothetical protein